MSEFAFNEALSIDIEKQAGESGIEVQRVYRRTYSTLPSDINEYCPDFIVSLHCNAFNESASGTEVLYYHRSTRGRQMAEILNAELVAALRLSNRGVKSRTSEDRGGYLLKSTSAPCVIAEPFFIDNDNDLQTAMDNWHDLVRAYSNAIAKIAQIL